MITYVDTSALLKLLIDEDGSDRASTIWTSADTVASVSLIVVEACAALAAAQRARRLTAMQHADAVVELHALLASLHIVEATDELIAAAAELAEAEALRGYDAVHLAAAVFVKATVFSGADTDLCAAAERRGFHVANPLDLELTADPAGQTLVHTAIALRPQFRAGIVLWCRRRSSMSFQKWKV